MTIDSNNAADPKKPTVKPVPYEGVQYVAIPEFQASVRLSASSSPQRWPVRSRLIRRSRAPSN